MQLFAAHYTTALPGRSQLNRFRTEVLHVIAAADSVISSLTAEELCGTSSQMLQRTLQSRGELLTCLAVLASPVEAVLALLAASSDPAGAALALLAASSAGMLAAGTCLQNIPAWTVQGASFQATQQFRTVGDGRGFEAAALDIQIEWSRLLQSVECSPSQMVGLVSCRQQHLRCC